MTENTPLLDIRNLSVNYGQVCAVNDVTFAIRAGECLGLVGESGSGKTTVAKAILRALKPSAGEMLFQANGKAVDLAKTQSTELHELRRHMQLIFQDPYSSLNPRMTVRDIVGEPLLNYGVRDRREREARVRELLRQVGLPEMYLNRYPHAFSGGQRQRIGIARALALNPKLIVADEPVSALDVSVRAQVLNLLQELQQKLGLTYLFIAHDLGVVRHIADRAAVMYVGRLVELAPVEELFTAPRHPYTAALLAAMPVPDPAHRTAKPPLSGEVTDPASPPPGCTFHPRCPHAIARCREEAPAFRELAPGHLTRCLRAEEITLSGIIG